MIARRIAANDEHKIGVLDVLQRDRGGSAAGDAREPDAARLMAVIAAVVDVIRPIQPSEQLQQKTCFVAAATTEVPECFVWIGFRELRGNAVERGFPGNRLVPS